MIIDSSSINMMSTRYYKQELETTTSEKAVERGTNNVSYSLNSSTITFTSSYTDFSSSLNEKLNNQNGLSTEAEPSQNYNNLNTITNASKLSSLNKEKSLNEQLIEKINEILKKIRNFYSSKSQSANFLGSLFDTSVGNTSSINLTSLGSTGSTQWDRTTSTAYEYNESEKTSFSTTGTAVTSDGRELSFNVSLNMERSFTENYTEISNDTYTVFTDPLVINLNENETSLSADTFSFDIDGNGEIEEIHSFNSNSGFLAYDINEDGKINDGSELFGTKSGNGFKDLSKYDEDKNGFIDENDSIYTKLKIWTKDSDGNDKLLDLKSQDIGAIYLGHSATDFNLNSIDDNLAYGKIRSTGMYFKESGGIGTIQQVDFANEKLKQYQ